MKNIDVECHTSIYVRVRASEQEGQVNLTADNTVIVEHQPPACRRLPDIADCIAAMSTSQVAVGLPAKLVQLLIIVVHKAYVHIGVSTHLYYGASLCCLCRSPPDIDMSALAGERASLCTCNVRPTYKKRTTYGCCFQKHDDQLP